MRLVLIRHGESEWNKLNLFTGWTDVDLSAVGHEEARQAGILLKKLQFDFDVCYTSYLKRAIHTLHHVLEEMELEWLPVIKTWCLNERHYGALQGLDKTETAKRYGEEQVRIWRRSYHVEPPLLSKKDKRNAHYQKAYRDVNKEMLPNGESLKATVERVVPYFDKEIKPLMMSGKNILIVAHGNSLRALMKYLEVISDDDIVKVNIPTGIPYVYEFDDAFHIVKKYYLGNVDEIGTRMMEVENQGKNI